MSQSAAGFKLWGEAAHTTMAMHTAPTQKSGRTAIGAIDARSGQGKRRGARPGYGQGGLGAMAWFFGMVLGVPAALIGAGVTTWWVVGKAGLPTRAWAILCALIYVPLIAAHGFSHW